MSAQDYGAAQPIADWVDKNVVSPARKVLGMADKIPAPTVQHSASQSTGWKPEPNAEQAAQIKKEQGGGPSYAAHSTDRKSRLARKYGSADGPGQGK